jgi:hypothetical protein
MATRNRHGILMYGPARRVGHDKAESAIQTSQQDGHPISFTAQPKDRTGRPGPPCAGPHFSFPAGHILTLEISGGYLRGGLI